MTPNFWTTPDGRELHTALARLAGWKQVPRPEKLPWGAMAGKPNYYGISELPRPADLIRELESGMTEEQKCWYAVYLAEHFSTDRTSNLDLFRLITAPDDIRGMAIVEVMKA